MMNRLTDKEFSVLADKFDVFGKVIQYGLAVEREARRRRTRELAEKAEAAGLVEAALWLSLKATKEACDE